MNILEIEEENDSKVYIFGEVSYPASDSVEEAMPYELICDSIISPQDQFEDYRYFVNKEENNYDLLATDL